MKKNVILSIVMLCSSLSFSQKNIYKITKGVFSNWGSIYNYTDYQLQNILSKQEAFKDRNVKSRTITYYYNHKPYQANQFFDKNGRLTQIKHIKKNKVNLVDYTYDLKGNVVKIVTTNSKSQKRISHFRYDSKSRLLESEHYNYKGDYSGRKIKYNKFDEVSCQDVFKKDKLNPVKSIAHSFYEGGEKKSTTYKENGKVKYQWKYDCKSEGELLNVKQKNKATICIKEDVDKNGNRIVWNREFNEKGELTKTKTTYKQDSLWISTYTYNKDDELITESVKTDKGEKSIIYKKGEKPYASSEFIYNEKKQLIKHMSTWKKSWNVKLYHYTSDLKTSEVRVGKKSTYIEEINYKFY